MMKRRTLRDERLQQLWDELNDVSEGRGFDRRQWVRTATKMERYQVAEPTEDETQALLSRLIPIMQGEQSQPVKAPGRFADTLLQAQSGVPSVWMRMLRSIMTQVQLFSAPFWILSALVVVIGAVLMGMDPGKHMNGFFLVLPLVSGLSVFYALRSYGSSMAVLEATFPMKPAEAALGRLCIIFAYDLALALAASFGLYGFGQTGPLMPFIVGWLVPLCLGTAFTFLVILRFGLWNGAVLSVIVWCSQFILGELLGPFYFVSGLGYKYWEMSRLIGAGITIVMAVAGYMMIRERGQADEGGRMHGDPA